MHIPKIVVIENSRPNIRRKRVMVEDIDDNLILSYKLGRRVRVSLPRH